MAGHAALGTLLVGSSVLLAATLAGCTLNGPSPPPVVVSSIRPVGLSLREQGYIECASALLRAYPPNARVRLRRGYQYRVLDEKNARLFQFSAYLDERGERRQAEFECTTERRSSPKVLSLIRLSTYPFES